MAQSTVFEQVIKLISRSDFQNIVNAHNDDKGLRTLNCWTWFGALLFGQLTGHDSIRAIERVFAHGNTKIKKLGFEVVKRSTLADANSKRSLKILEDLFQYTLGRAYQIAPNKTGFRFTGEVFALDSTTIELCLSLCPWAKFHHDKGATKLHTAIDIANDLPQFAVITHGRTHDLKAIRDEISFLPGSTNLFDRAYVDYG